MLTVWIVRATRHLRAVLAREQQGQGLVEYSLIIVFVAIVLVFALSYLEPNIARTLNNVSNSL